MTRLFKYLKPYTWLILLTVVLLFIQAFADLSLPTLMADIVNVGIQQGGVENAVAEAIRQSELDKLLIFMTDAEKTQVLGSYTLVDQNSPDYDKYVEIYPALANEPIYVLNDLSQAEIDSLNPIMAQSWVAVSTIEMAMADPAKAALLAQGSAFDLSKLPPGMDIFTVLAKLPPAQLAQVTSAIDQRFAALGEPVINQIAIKAVQAEYTALGVDDAKLQTSYIVQSGLLMLVVTLIAGVCAIIVGYLSAVTAAGLARDLRRNVFQKVESFSNTEFDKFSTASLITRTTNDITQIQMVVLMVMRMVIYAPIVAIGGIIKAVQNSTSMWWIIVLAVAILLSLIVTVFTVSLPKFKSMQKLIDRLNLVTRENLSGMMVIRAFNMQPFEEDRFDTANKNLTGTLLFVNRVMVIMMPAIMLLLNCTMVLIVWVGAHEVASYNMQVGDMMAFMQYTMQIVFSFIMLAMMFIILPRASVSADRIADVLGTTTVINDPAQPKQFSDSFQGTIEFRNVSFRYPAAEEDVLHDISFTARPGETTAFIGTTGSGKSTIVSLIPRFYEVTEGGVLLDGIDIREVTQHDLRAKIGYVPQKSSLFSGTIESNLSYADENATTEELTLAAEVAQATEIIASKDEGMQAEIAQGGMNVSGGQKQRLAIARALVKKAPIYIFDDSFSALDFKTDSALRRALKANTGSSTVLIVTQRIATIKNAEQIIVLDEGKIVGKGAHRELMKDCEVYRSIALSQLSQEELA